MSTDDESLMSALTDSCVHFAARLLPILRYASSVSLPWGSDRVEDISAAHRGLPSQEVIERNIDEWGHREKITASIKDLRQRGASVAENAQELETHHWVLFASAWQKTGGTTGDGLLEWNGPGFLGSLTGSSLHEFVSGLAEKLARTLGSRDLLAKKGSKKLGSSEEGWQLRQLASLAQCREGAPVPDEIPGAGMFWVFMHQLDVERRLKAESAALDNGKTDRSPTDEAVIWVAKQKTRCAAGHLGKDGKIHPMPTSTFNDSFKATIPFVEEKYHELKIPPSWLERLYDERRTRPQQ